LLDVPWRALAVLKIVPIQTEDLHDVLEVLSKQPDWNGTLEDASVAMLALRMGASVWTLDYRHLSAFKTVSFWNP
jgi:predicted nucleic acid-binding protein